MNYKPINLVLLAGFLVSGCAVVGPNYEPPTIDLAAEFVEGSSASADQTAHLEWWLQFNDPLLTELVERGLQQNLDIQAAIERINAAAAQLGSTGLASQASGSLTSQTQRTGVEGFEADTASSTSVNSSFVIDLFGGIAREQEQALANADAAHLDVGAAQLAYLSSMVDHYISARYYQEALELTRQNVASQARTLSIVESQRELGVTTDLNVAQARAQLDQARASIPGLEIGFHTSVYRIATLLAEPAAPLLGSMQSGAPQPHSRSNTGAGIPANLLRNRPDLWAAERRYASALAAVGVAEAALYPSLTLSGSVTIASPDSWSFGPSIQLPILGRGALASQRDVQISNAQQAEIEWRTLVLEAVEDVQIAQASYLRRQREVSSLRNAVASNRVVLDLTRSSFESGDQDVLDLLDTERNYADSRLSLAAAVRDLSSAWVTLQIASGRGWNTRRPVSAEPSN
ncbi:efflux transporter outer membrane subunit [Gymnodinialimonas hymeniacidonis]|uniref:efflux transporter outer membrane subunit n=1 Tax=Gymnodinialimonas hymeniacidonis TaxID=3126508 RepID=UPI0034C63905